MNRLVKVAIPVSRLDLLTYRVPEGMEMPSVGARVIVPLGRRVLTGCVISDNPELSELASDRIKDVLSVLDVEEFIPLKVLQLAVWTAEYYLSSIADVITAAMPPGGWKKVSRLVRLTEHGAAELQGGSVSGQDATLLHKLSLDHSEHVDRIIKQLGLREDKVDVNGLGRRRLLLLIRKLETQALLKIEYRYSEQTANFKTVKIARLSDAGYHSVGKNGGKGIKIGRLGQRQQQLIALLQDQKAKGLPLNRLRKLGISTATAHRLSDMGVVEIEDKKVERDPWIFEHGDNSSAQAESVTLTDEQDRALSELIKRATSRKFHVALLHGVTGSGKTEIYLRLAKFLQDSNRQSIILVPEIALTPAMADAFRLNFGASVAIQHSGLSSGERHDQWHRIRSGEIDIVIGTRSAIFAPLQRVGLVVVDEEHDGSYKQDENPRYHARDLAIVRGQQAEALIVLGSATPSMESYHNAILGRYSLLELTRRVYDRPLPQTQIINMRDEYALNGPGVIFSAALRAGIAERLKRGEQTLILLNRRGFAAAMICRQCGALFECPNCSVSLTVHGRNHQMRCHYCGHAEGIKKTCAQCRGEYLEQIGLGTQRVETELQSTFPKVRVGRIDRDTVRRRGALSSLLKKFGQGELDVLVGTQMIAKGHDFPNVTLVGVVSADVGLGVPDFRAAERTFQLLTQVAGRAGRGERPGETIVQTLHPDHYSLYHACQQNYKSFYKEELTFRKRMRYPPTVALANMVIKHRSAGSALKAASKFVTALREKNRYLEVLGPAPAPLERLKGHYRVQVLAKGSHRREMREALEGALEICADFQKQIIIDVDPVSVL